METLQLTTLLVNCHLTSNRNTMCDIIEKKKKRDYFFYLKKKNYMGLSFHTSNIFLEITLHIL